MEETKVKRAKGKSLNRTEADYFELSAVRKPDIDLAANDWREKTIPAYRGLIDATIDDEE